jgi:hypothetical protein
MRKRTTTLLNSVVGLVRTAAAARPPAPGRKTGSRNTSEELMAELSRLTGQLQDLAAESAHLKVELARLDRDLDESRRLNLRAAELLDIVYTELSSGPASQPRANHRQTPEAGGGGA